jgi:MFS family permease
VSYSPQAHRSDIRLLYAARCLRGFGDGFAVIILPAYLTAIGLSPVQIGFVATASLAGTAALTLLVGLIAPRHDLRNMLLLGAGLMTFTGIALPSFEYLAYIAAVAFVGTINPSTGDIGVLVPLEHSMLARHAADEERTRTFARYSLIGALSMAAGALAAGLADIFVAWGFTKPAAFRLMFYLYAVLGVGAALLYRLLPHARAEPSRPHAPLGPSRGIVYKLAALFGLDAFAGGFIAQSLVALWLFQKFELSVAAASLFLLLVGCVERVLLSGRGAPRRPHRPQQHDGLHPHPLEHLPDPRSFLAEPGAHPRPAPGAGGVVADGRTDPHLLRDGRGHAARTNRGRERHGGTAQPRLLDQPGVCGRAADASVLRAAARFLRQPEDHL